MFDVPTAAKPRLILIALFFFVLTPVLAQDPAVPSATPEIFTDVTQEAGITWKQFSGKSPDRFLIETMGGDVGFLDFDGDGLLDIFFVNGGETPHGKSSVPVRNALYRNLGNGRFEDVAGKAGVCGLGFFLVGGGGGGCYKKGRKGVFFPRESRGALFFQK